jgi:linoleoyl-CoA desaturase
MTNARSTAGSDSQAPPRAKFPPHGELYAELNRRVEAYFEDGGIRKSGGRGMWLKAWLLLAWFWGAWVLAVFWAGPWWQVALCATSLGLAIAGVGFAVMHDGAHGATSRRKWLNRLAASSLDMVGGSSYMWRFKHNILHHTYPNIEQMDEDIDAQPFLRLAPGQPRYPFHRFQPFYFWLIYGFLPSKWHFFDDFRYLFSGRVNGHRVPRPGGWDLALFVSGKLFLLTWAFVIPLLFHSLGWAVAVYAWTTFVAGVTLGTVFQLAHCVDGVEFERTPSSEEALSRCWATHQLATTANFSPGSRLVTEYVGGLNYQIEHHLFPRICHEHYSALSPIVKDLCAEYGVPHITNRTLWQAISSHVRHLERMGRPV